MNIFIFHVKSKHFKKPAKIEWIEARVEIDSVNKKLLFSVPRESNELYEEYETCEPNKEAEAAQQPSIQPQYIDMSEFRPPKIKGDGKETTKKGETIYRLELPGRSRVNGKSLKMSCLDQTMFQEFCMQLRPHFNQGPDGAHSASVLSLSQVGRHHSSDSSRQQKPLQPQSELLEVAVDGEYATVQGDGANADNGQRQIRMTEVKSNIYEAFETERCFQVTFDQIRSDTDLPQVFRQLNRGDPIHLYISTTKLELLSREKCMMCDWPLTQIRSFKHSDQQVQIEVGIRTVSGRSLLSFNFDSIGLSAAARFAQLLSNHLSLPPECACCLGNQGKHRELGDQLVGQSVRSNGSSDGEESDNVDDEDNDAGSDGLCSNPCYYEDQEQLGSNQQLVIAEKPKKKTKKQVELQQQRRRMQRQTKMKSAEPDYYSSVVRKPQTANKPPLVSPTSAAVAAATAAIAASAESPSAGSQQRPGSAMTPNRQTSLEAAQPTPPLPQPPPLLPPREASADLADDAYESIVAIPPAGYADDDKFVKVFSDALAQEQQQKTDRKATSKLQKKAKK